MEIKQILLLTEKELKLEWRKRSVISSLLLYVVSTVFILYMALFKVEPAVWNGLFWITLLFASVNTNSRSFSQEGETRRLYYYTLTDPLNVIVSKIFYNTLLLWCFALLAYLTFVLLLGNPVKDYSVFFQALIAGPLGFSVILTFLAAITTDRGSNSTMLAILGFPALIPVLLLMVKISAQGLQLISNPDLWKDFLLLSAVDLILLALIFVLFPYLWKE